MSNSSIVYRKVTRKAVEAVYKLLDKKYSGQVTMSHAGLKPKARMANESAFLSGEKTIMVATTAFGMGIDLDSVDFVIHFNMPLSLTDYMQQSGRAAAMVRRHTRFCFIVMRTITPIWQSFTMDTRPCGE